MASQLESDKLHQTSGEPSRNPSGQSAEEKKIYNITSDGDRMCSKPKQVRVLRELCEASSAVCEITVKIPRPAPVDGAKQGKDIEFGTCFLGEFRVNNKPIFGLFTANHLLGDRHIRNDGVKVTIANHDLVRGTDGPVTYYSRTTILPIHKSTFFFTCPLLDATFIQFDDDLKEELSKKGFTFLPVQPWRGQVRRSELHILHYAGETGDHDQYFSSGHLDKYHGLHLFHTVSTDIGSSGAPVLDESCDKVVAIHTSFSTRAEARYNIAVDARSVLTPLCEAWKRQCKQINPNQTRELFVLHHPTESDLMYCKKTLHSLGLEVHPLSILCITGDKESNMCYRIPFCYIHQGHVDGVEHKVPIYFVLTSHGWYWSDVHPITGSREPYWIPATESHFDPESQYRGKTVEEVNGFTFAKLRKIVPILDFSGSNVEGMSNKEE